MIDQIFDKFYEQQLTTAEIAKQFSVTESSIVKMMHENPHIRKRYLARYRVKWKGEE